MLIPGFDHTGCSHDQLAGMPFMNHTPNGELNILPEMCAVGSVDTAIHKAETIGRAHHRIEIDIQQRVIADLDIFKLAADRMPGIDNARVEVGKNKLHGWGNGSG